MAEPESLGQVLQNSPTLAQAKASPSLPMSASEAALREGDRIRTAAAKLKCSGVEDRHLSKSPEVLRQHKEWSAMVDRAWKLLEASAPILAFLGDRGNGKTQAAVTLIRRTITYEQKTAKYLRCRQVGALVRASYRPDSEVSEVEVMSDLARSWLLVLDECQERFTTDHELQTLTMLLDLRYGACRPTILIANCSEADFVALMGPAIIDRMREGGGALTFTWASFRGGRIST